MITLKVKKMKVIFTGINSTTAERLFKIKHLLKNTFFLTYGDHLLISILSKRSKIKIRII